MSNSNSISFQQKKQHFVWQRGLNANSSCLTISFSSQLTFLDLLTARFLRILILVEIKMCRVYICPVAIFLLKIRWNLQCSISWECYCETLLWIMNYPENVKIVATVQREHVLVPGKANKFKLPLDYFQLFNQNFFT